MGDPASRASYVEKLSGYLLDHADAFGADFRERVEQNPLRVLDSKRDDWQDVIEHAPQITEHLSDESREHFERVQAGLDRLGIRYELAPRLVRGFDYYTSTTFEFLPDLVDAAQTSIGGGGRYDQLAEQLGGAPTPGIGFGMGIERVLIACDAEGVFSTRRPRVDAFVVNGLGAGGDSEVAGLVAVLRENGLRVERAYGDRSVKAQWKAADRSRAVYGVMLGRAEAERNGVAVKDLRSGEQVEVPRDALVAWLRRDGRKRHWHDAHGSGGRPRGRRHRSRRRGVRMGRQPPRPRRCRVPRHPRHGGHRAGRRRSREPGGRAAHRVRGEYVVRVEGSVRARPEGTVNDTLPTGEIEVGATVLEMLNEAETVPFPIDDRIDADEVLRLRHRYLDLRRPRHAAQPPHPCRV